MHQERFDAARAALLARIDALAAADPVALARNAFAMERACASLDMAHRATVGRRCVCIDADGTTCNNPSKPTGHQCPGMSRAACPDGYEPDAPCATCGTR